MKILVNLRKVIHLINKKRQNTFFRKYPVQVIYIFHNAILSSSLQNYLLIYCTSSISFYFKIYLLFEYFKKKMASPVGLEPTTLWLTVRCSNRLSYGDTQKKKSLATTYFPGTNPSIVGVNRLNCRVRNVTGCIPAANITKL